MTSRILKQFSTAGRTGLLIFAGMIVLGSSLIARVQSKQSGPEKGQMNGGVFWEREVRAAEQRHRLAFLENDVAALRQMFSDQFIVNNPQNAIAQKEQVIDMVRSGTLRISSFDQQIDQIRRFGDIVVVMGGDAVVYVAPAPNAGQTQRRRFTDIWRLENSEWRFIARQATIVVE